MSDAVLALADFDRLARRVLPRCIYGFAAHGSEDETSLAANRRAYAETMLAPRVLVDVSSREQGIELFGRRYASPFGIAPMGGAALFRREADLVLARAAHDERVPFILSAASSVPLERISREAPGSWYQAYLPADRGRIDGLLARLEAAGYEVLAVTADVPVAANRENDLRLGFGIPVQPGLRLACDGLAHPRWLAATVLATLWRDGMPHFENFGAERGGPIVALPGPQFRALRDRLDWADFAYLRSRWKGRLLLKGVLRVADAVRACEAGADGIIVSNHGGRQLDGALAPLRVLPAMAAALPGTVLIVDGGVRRGTDALKALALGARMVFVGRPMLYAAAVAGAAGVRQAIGLLRGEIDRDLALLGCPHVAGLDRSFVAAP